MANVREDDERQARAAARRGRTVLLKTRFNTLDDAAPVSGVEGVSLVRELTRRSWALAGRDTPSYDRDKTPLRRIRRAAQ